MSPIQTSTVDTAVAEPATRPPSFDLTSPPTATSMRVTKRNGGSEAVDLNKIVRAVTRAAEGLHAVEPMRVREVTDDAERSRLWALSVAAFPPYADYAKRTSRRIPVFIAERSGQHAA